MTSEQIPKWKYHTIAESTEIKILRLPQLYKWPLHTSNQTVIWEISGLIDSQMYLHIPQLEPRDQSPNTPKRSVSYGWYRNYFPLVCWTLDFIRSVHIPHTLHIEPGYPSYKSTPLVPTDHLINIQCLHTLRLFWRQGYPIIIHRVTIFTISTL